MFLDIECSNLKADIGHVIAIGMIKNGKKEVRFVGNLEEEKEALKWLRKELEGCDLIITWYGSGFDLPFLITRGIINDVDLSKLLKIRSLDLCEFCRKSLSFSKNNLSHISKSLDIPKNKEVDGTDVLKLYLKAVRGDKTAEKEIIDHCLNDLEALEKIFKKFEPYLSLGTKTHNF